jgi:hypothetical protein
MSGLVGTSMKRQVTGVSLLVSLARVSRAP